MFMRKLLFVTALIFNILTITNIDTNAQNTAPTYQSLISMGDKEFSNEEYIKAKSYYQEALRIKKDDPTAKNKLNKTLQRIREVSEKEEVFYQQIDIADSQYSNGDYEKALDTYKNAKKMFPKDEYVNNKIDELTKIISDEKDKIESFNATVKMADDFMNQKKYTEALLQYKAALEVYPNHSLTKDKYNEAKFKKEEYDRQNANFEQLKREAQELTLRKKYAEAIEKYNKALEIFPSDTDTKDVIKTLTDKKNITDKYNSKIQEADSLYLVKSYEKSKTAYKEALDVIPDDSYSSDMIARIDETLNSSEYKSLKNFLNLLEEAKALEAKNETDAALGKYKSALQLNPGDEFTIQKIDYLTNIINDRNKEIELNAQYATLIQNGDKCIEKEDFYTALDHYTQAYTLIPNRIEAKEKKDETQKRIKEIEAQLALEKQKWEEYYNTAMKSAQDHMNGTNYAEAIKEYNKALRYKEGDIAATQGLEKATELNNAKMAAVINEYNQYISSADVNLNNKNYEKALELYSKAHALNTGYSYPSEKINEISSMLQANKLEELVSSNTQILANETKRFTFNTIDVKLRRNCYLLIKARNTSDKGFPMFVMYGDKNGKNGSFVVRTPNNKEINDYIIKIGAQNKWFSEDNTWIEITPQNGDIEIELIEITKGN